MKFFFFILFIFFNLPGQAQNLIMNGNFNSENPVQSNLSYSKFIVHPGKYTITDKAESHNNSFVTPPSSDGNFMVADMEEYSGNQLWRATIHVEANKTYSVSFLAANIAKDFENPSRLRITVNGKNIGTIFMLPGNSNQWIVCQAVYKTSSAKEIVLAIENLVTISRGNDLAIDNILFVETEDTNNPRPQQVKRDTTPIVNKLDSVKLIPDAKISSLEPIKKDSSPSKEVKPVPVVSAVKKISPVAKNKPVVPVKKTPAVQKAKITPPVKKIVSKQSVLVKENKPAKSSPIPVQPKPVPKKKTSAPKPPAVMVAKAIPKEKEPPVVKKDTDLLISAKTQTSEEVFSKPPVAGEKLQLNHVYFEQSKTILLPSSYPEVDNLVNYMNKYPSVRIRLEGHTDTHGDPHDNQVLSEQRVQFIKTYMVQKGIKENRIEWIGYGSAKPLNSNRIEALRKLNRRVEVVLL